MTTTESLKPSLTGPIRKMTRENQAEGDRNTFNKPRWNIYNKDVSSYEESFSAILNGGCIEDLFNQWGKSLFEGD